MFDLSAGFLLSVQPEKVGIVRCVRRSSLAFDIQFWAVFLTHWTKQREIARVVPNHWNLRCSWNEL